MKAITTLFESILSTDDSNIWRPTDGPTEAAGRGWQWGGVNAGERGWQWGGVTSRERGWQWGG